MNSFQDEKVKDPIFPNRIQWNVSMVFCDLFTCFHAQMELNLKKDVKPLWAHRSLVTHASCQQLLVVAVLPHWSSGQRLLRHILQLSSHGC